MSPHRQNSPSMDAERSGSDPHGAESLARRLFGARSDALFDALYEHAKHLAGILDPDGRLLHVNGTACRMVGRMPEELLGQPFWETPWWTHSAVEQTKLREAIVRASAGEFVQFETTHLAADGDLRHLQFWIRPAFDEEGRVFCLIPESIDVTDERRADVERRRAEARQLRLQRAIVRLVGDPRSHEGLSSSIPLLLEQACSVLKADRASLWLLDSGGGSLACLDVFDALQGEHRVERALRSADVARHLATVGERRAFCAQEALSDPRLSEFSEPFRERGVRSVVDAAVRRDGRLAGFVRFEQIQAERRWHLDEVGFAGQVADLVERLLGEDERRRAQAELRESERTYREIFNATSDALFVLDEAAQVIDVNDPACRLFGCQRLAVLGRPLDELFADDGDGSLTGELLRPDSLRSERALVRERRGRRIDGREFWAEISLRAAEIGSRPRVIASLRDIDERVRAKELLLAEKRFTDSLIDSLPAIFYLYDSDLRLVRWNRHHETALGYGPDEMRGRALADWHGTPEERRFAVQAARQVLDEGVVGVIEGRLHGKDGRSRPYMLTGVRFDTPDGPMLVGVGIDVSAIAEAEEEKAALNQQLQQAMKMEAVGRLAGGVAHDFNNLLTAITGNVELAQLKVGAEHELAEHLDEVRRAADSAASLTRQLLAFSRRQLVEPKTMRLNSLVESIQKLLARVIGEDVELEIDLDPRAGVVHVDPGQFTQVLVNLAVNARDAMPVGGRLTLSTAPVEAADGRPARLGLDGSRRWTSLAVSDTGHGMGPEVIAHIFEPFFTTKPAGHGTGLGLATIFGAVRQAGGAIDVVSAPGAGSTFTVFLPLEEKRTPDETPALPDAAPRTGSETVLLVEDDRGVRDLARAMLSRLGYRVLAAADGAAALERARGHEGEIHLLLTDVVMPGMNGRELAEALVAERPETRVLFASGYTRDVMLRHGIVEGRLHFLGKPYRFTELAAKLREVLDGPRAVFHGSGAASA